MNYDEIIKNTLDEKRYLHTKGVVNTAIQLADKYGADKEKASIAAYLHDYAKPLKYDESLMLIDKFGIILDEETLENKELLHAPLGMIIAKYEFGISDEEILDAIRYHTTGKENMPLLTKIIYLADLIEPSRNFDGVDKIRELAFKDLDQALIVSMNNTIVYLIQKNSVIHSDTYKARNYIIRNWNRGK
ncbi:HD domain-containing protein [Soehngenia longivitae]|uniref:bis(5'-nucleosyl)-tetraphosphatase (symmetrical) n=1 Tax=Soehngenia longivitae TaxID=2562294 RepID=A0A4Z0D2P8_9FIRM|nr:bis(5'-nucleosyl)-tetraphosphatase (symmetrical) YqeK [Soehngenia longivitae]TFZ40030.1 HD domain-containing protein [Soehngenia longivitae]